MSFLEQSSLPRVSFKQDMAYIGVLVFIVIVLMCLNFWYTVVSSRHDKDYIRIAGELRILSQTISQHATSAIDGIPDAFSLLKKSRDNFAVGLNVLKYGDVKLGLPASDNQIQSNELLNVEEMWRFVKDKTDLILSQNTLLMSLNDIEETSSKIAPQIQVKLSNIMEVAGKGDKAILQVILAAKQSVLIERIVKNITKVMQGKENSAQAAKMLQADMNVFAMQLENMYRGANVDIKNNLSQISELYTTLTANAKRVLDASVAFDLIQRASYDIYRNSQNLLDKTTILSNAYILDSERRFIGEPTGYMLGATGLLLLIWLGYRIVSDTKEALALTAAQHKVNRAAVLLLLDELENLANGDLRAHTTIGAEITGAIAESVNSAIDALRRLVFTINDTAVQVSNSAQKVQSTTKYLEQASENQAGEIVGASMAVNAMATSAQQVAEHAIESSQVAQASVLTAQSGVSMVHNTILGMERIRGQIQETAKKIKKLGESTQEIGEIVSLINDITDQTNILALNASIQAATAGEAGKGFAVVAQEVQRLAERSSKATRQIEMIVNAIQSDTNDTIVSMGQTSQEVVGGTTLAKDAGIALEKIETVSLNLRELIQKISIAAKEQVTTASKISQTMDVIQEITTQTTLGTHETAGSIGALAELAIELRDSVTGFKLPTNRQGDMTKPLDKEQQLAAL